MIIFKGGLKMSLVESSNSDNSLESTWIFSRVELEWTRKEAFCSNFSNINCLSGEYEETCDET